MTKVHPRCCPCAEEPGSPGTSFTRRDFLKGTGVAALGSVAAGALSWPLFAGHAEKAGEIWRAAPLKVKPILVHSIPTRGFQTSWRNWGGIETAADARAEVARIEGELGALTKRAEFPLEFLPVPPVRQAADLSAIGDMGAADAFLVYAAGGWMDVFDALDKTGKDRIYFCRHKSGPVYLWYEIISPRYLRQHGDSLAVKGVDEDDVVIDSQDELLWRFRALAGLRNTVGTKILAVGGPAAWSEPEGPGSVVKRVIDTWKFDIVNVSYNDLGRLIREARADAATVRRARSRADAYLKTPGTSLETERSFVENGLLLDEVFRALMKKAGCRALTINGCMGTIMPLAETSACLTLSTLNDDGYLAFCESDFVVIPSGVLLANIAGTAGVPQRPDLSSRRHHHPGPLHGAAEDGRPEHGAGPHPDPFRVGLRRRPQGRDGQGPGSMTNIAPDFASQALAGPSRRDRGGPIPAHLPLPDRHPLQVRRPDPGQAHARLPLDDRLRRPHPGGGLRPEARRHRLGFPGLGTVPGGDCPS